MPELETLQNIKSLLPGHVLFSSKDDGKIYGEDELALFKIKEYIAIRTQEINDELEETFKTINEE